MKFAISTFSSAERNRNMVEISRILRAFCCAFIPIFHKKPCEFCRWKRRRSVSKSIFELSDVRRVEMQEGKKSTGRKNKHIRTHMNTSMEKLWNQFFANIFFLSLSLWFVVALPTSFIDRGSGLSMVKRQANKICAGANFSRYSPFRSTHTHKVSCA